MDGLLRVRTKDERVTTYRTEVPHWSHPVQQTNVRPVSWSGQLSTIHDNNHPGFRRKQKRGEIVMDGVLLERQSRSFVPGSITLYDVGYFEYWSGDLCCVLEFQSPDPPPVNFGTSMEQSVLTSAYAKINQSPLISGEILSDLDKTVSMLKRPYRGATDLARRILRAGTKNRGKTAKSAQKAMAGAWLEHRYGWSPLMMDVESICKEVRQKNLRALDRRRLVVREGQSASAKSTKSFSDAIPYYWDQGARGTAVTVKTVRCSAGVIYDVASQDALENLTRVTGTRLRDLPATLWEITPYSFVVDWFSNVGTWIQAVTPVPGVTIRDSWLTKVTEVVRTVNGTMIPHNPNPPDRLGRDYTGSFGSSTRTSLTYERIPRPAVANLPVLTGKPLSVLHSLDAIALSSKSLLGVLGKLKH